MDPNATQQLITILFDDQSTMNLGINPDQYEHLITAWSNHISPYGVSEDGCTIETSAGKIALSFADVRMILPARLN